MTSGIYGNGRPHSTDIHYSNPSFSNRNTLPVYRSNSGVNNNVRATVCDDVRLSLTTGFAETGEEYLKRRSNWSKIGTALQVYRPSDGNERKTYVPEDFRALIKESASIDLPVASEKYYLHKLARDGDHQRISSYLSKYWPKKEEKRKAWRELEAEVNMLDILGLSPLHYALRENHLAATFTLIHYQADVNLGSRDERASPLHFAARSMTRTENCTTQEQEQRVGVPGLQEENLISALIKNGANVRATTVHKRTPLHFTAITGNVFAALVLVKNASDGDIEVTDGRGKTALHLAVTHEHYDVVKLLIGEGACIHRAFKPRETTPLHVACRTGNIPVVQLFIEEEVKYEAPNARSDIVAKMLENPDASGETPLHLAIRSERVELVRLILSKNRRIDYRNSHGETALHIAVCVRSLALVKLLVEGYWAPIDDLDIDRVSPLQRAATQNHESCLQSPQTQKECTLVFLLKKTAELKQCAINWDTLMAAARSSHPQVVNLLLADQVSQPRVNIKLGNLRDQTPVWIAACTGDISTLKVLLAHNSTGDTIQMPDLMGYTPLHIAAEKGHLQCVRELLRNNAGIDSKNMKGEGPIHVATRANQSEIVSDLLGRQPGLISSKDGRGRTILHLAAKIGQEKTATEIMKSCPRLDEKDDSGLTPLMTAASYGKHRLCKMLIDAGASVDRSPQDILHSNGEKMTALMLACREGHLNVASLLLDHHADVTEVDDKGRNCLSIAIDNDHKHIAELILSSSIWKVAMKNMMFDEKHSLPDTPMRKAIRRMPDIAERILQKCIRTNEGVLHEGKMADGEEPGCEKGLPITPAQCEHFCIVYGCEFIDDTPVVESGSWPGNWHGRATEVLGNKRIKENHPLMIMYQEKQLSLLNHVVVYELLRNKWRYGAWAFFLNLALYSAYVLMLTIYICTVPSAFHYYVNSENVLTNLANNTSYCDAMRELYFSTSHYQDSQRISNQTMKYAIIIIIIFKILGEIMQIAIRKWGYLLEIENYIEWVMYVSAILLVLDLDPCLKDTGLRTSWQWQIGAVAILLTWIDFILFLQKAPRFGTFIIMLQHVSIEILRLVPLLFLSILAFALAFFALLHNQMPFSGVPESLLKTFVMTLGEFEFQSTLLAEEGDWKSMVILPETTFIIFVAFMIFMAIVFMNLLTGVAVNDIARTKNKALTNRRRMQIELALDVDTTLRRLEEYGRILRCIKRGTFMSKMRQRDIILYPNRKKRGLFELIYMVVYGKRRSPKSLKALSETVQGKGDFGEESAEESMVAMQQSIHQLVSRMVAMETRMAKMEQNMNESMQQLVKDNVDHAGEKHGGASDQIAKLDQRLTATSLLTETLLRKLTADINTLLVARSEMDSIHHTEL